MEHPTERFTFITNSNTTRFTKPLKGEIVYELPVEYVRSRHPMKHIKILNFQYINMNGQIELADTLHSPDLQSFDDYDYYISSSNYSYINSQRWTPSDDLTQIRFYIKDYKDVQILPHVMLGTYQIQALLVY